MHVASQAASHVAMSSFRNALRRSLLPSKRYTAIFCYNSPSWRQPQQLRQRLNPQRRIQSSGAFIRSARTAGDEISARPAVAQAFASTASSAPIARHAVVPAYASTASSAPIARRAVVPAYASTASSATTARLAVAPATPATASTKSECDAYASTTGGYTNAPSVRTSRAPWKAAHCTATVSVQPKCY